MTRKSSRATSQEIVRRLDPLYADLTTGLNYNSALELLVATILSAQCTDERVNMVTPVLFERYPTAQSFADADQEEIEGIIHSCGFYRNKARNIQAMARALLERFGGKVPRTMADLITLPGVARKTANVVLAHAFALHEGIAVDTHVQRLSGRLGLSRQTDPQKIERDLMALFRKDDWGRVSDVLIWHGRRICGARNPQCQICVLADICPSVRTDLA